jgi:hypothetical protein
MHCEQGMSWYGTNIVDSPSGKLAYGTEYTINTMVWAVPAAMEGQDFSAPFQPGGLVDRVLRAATGETVRPISP